MVLVLLVIIAGIVWVRHDIKHLGPASMPCVVCGQKTTNAGRICLDCNRRHSAYRWEAHDERRERPPPRPVTESDTHSVLGVERDASRSQIRRAYRALMRKHHPDAVAHLGVQEQAAATRRAQIINRAYELLIKRL